ncbi:probable disease resistance protein At4g27220 [Magnolia sinica]|uniref:probable disease resistance protein At4g27220 n=1 Tax=Magnolia sinica TaxID=86752 RepID=UPI002658FD09|nr:probable disease resistance protein At4g27220 [Magnolia sinica]
MAMETLGSIILSITVQAGKYFCSFIFSMATIFIKFRSNLEELEQYMKQLANLKTTINEELESADKEGRLPNAGVKEWLKDVEEIQIKVNLIEEEVTANVENPSGCVLNCCMLHRLSKEAVEKLVDVKEAIDLADFPMGVVTRNPRARAVEEIPVPPIMGQRAAMDTLEQILELLEDKQVGKIGIWGMGGVGKTTIVKNLNNKLECSSSAHAFDVIIWVTVSKDSNMKRVQSQVAKRLNVRMRKGEIAQELAIRLFAELKGKKFLLILDDIWEKIDLDELGIPHGEGHKGFKIILTTRSLDVCRGTKMDKDIRVEVLSDEEAWTLFCQNAGDMTDLDRVGDLTRAVARECSGLPLVIITVGRAMRGKPRIDLWKHALEELRSSVPDIRGIEKEVLSPLKWSYDSLQGKNIKPCFLYCSLFPEDYSIEASKLVQYWIAEGLINERQNFEAASNRGIALIENLKDSCLLDKGAHEGTVKMHDVVRDVAIWIASSLEDGSKFFVQSGMGLNQLPEEGMWESTKRASFIQNKIRRLPDRMVGCSKLSTLHLQSNPVKEILEGFFTGLQALTVLNLSETFIKSLPLSLTELRQLPELPPMGQLTELQTLDLSGTQISELPSEIGQLDKLKQLNLSRTLNLESIKAGRVSRLSSLEVFDVSLSAYTWDVEQKADEGRSTIEELSFLRFLSVLYIRIHSIACLALDFSWLKRLRRFHICIGPRTYVSEYSPMWNNERSIIMSGVDLSGEGADVLLSSTSALVLGSCKGLNSISGLVQNSNFNLATLQSVRIEGFRGITSVIKGEDVQGSILPNLEELDLHSLGNLTCIWEGVVPNGESLRKLRALRVGGCPLSSLIAYDLLPQLENLEEIKVSSCYNMRAIFEEKEAVEVTKLNGESLGKLRTIKVDHCVLLKSLISYDLLRQLKNLEEIEVRNCSQMEEIITTEEVADGQASDIIKEEGNAIPRLGILKLFSLKVSDCPLLQKDSQSVAHPRFLEDRRRFLFPNGE